jgi:death-on-curing protein
MARYLAAEEILAIHALIVEETGGSDGVREPGLLSSIARRPQASFGGAELHPHIFAKAAALCEAIANYHVFVDGNKRTAFASAARFLHVNGYELVAPNREVERVMVAVAEKRMDEQALALWLKKHSRKPRSRRT